MTTSVEVRQKLVDLLRRDLIGPHPELDPDLEREVLSGRDKPSRWYVGGFIAPAPETGSAPESEDEKAEREQNELLASEAPDEAIDKDADEQETPDKPPRDNFLPSSIGLTVTLPENVKSIQCVASWGDYRTEPPLPDALVLPDEEQTEQIEGKKPPRPADLRWVRAPGRSTLTLDVTKSSAGIPLPESAAPQKPGGGLEIALHQKLLQQTSPEGKPERLRVVTVFLVNRRHRRRPPYGDIAYAFQARLKLRCEEGFHPRCDVSSYQSDEPDLRIADLHYRDVRSYAVGHNVSGGWKEVTDLHGMPLPVTTVWTDPLPTQEVEKIAPSEITGVEFGMEALAAIATHGADAIGGALDALPVQYERWRKKQEEVIVGLARRRAETARALIGNMDAARRRIESGIALLKADDRARDAFGMMNSAMAAAARRRDAVIQHKKPDELDPPTWRPFQLAFILLNLAGLTDGHSPDREIVDLLFFPTGGGKTEAYLALAACVILLRRMRARGVLGAGVSVIMRYTLRLLTLDQLSRAAGLVCALELMRIRDEAKLGTWPIEIGLWVGQKASPNVMKSKKPGTNPDAATTWLRRYQRDSKREKSPVPLKACPWCGTPFKAECFSIYKDKADARTIAMTCANPECDFTRDRPLPVLVVDETIYRRLPAFLIATVDKFASLPWVGKTGAFFGNVDRHDGETGFFGASEPGEGTPLGHALDPPDLIIQDELHLISGPLGTVAGLYEAAIDLLTSRTQNGRRVRPKIVASTATVRRAQSQICRLFNRAETAVFPPPGIDRRHSFFAETLAPDREAARLYLGIASQGRGPKLLFLRTLQTLLAGAAAQSIPPAPGCDDPADPYMTVLSYFNALRELGGARRIVDGEVRERLGAYGDERRRVSPHDQPFQNRSLREPLELTSRVSTDEVAQTKEKLGAAVILSDGKTREESVDVGLATNMISVGLDIPRLGLMTVQGQPKSTAEYIQATSRVGRDSKKPGLVVAILNIHKPRDRTHYEQFRAYHASFYRAVEATSVTPFSARALDRALASLLVAAARHLEPALSPSDAVKYLKDYPQARGGVLSILRERAQAAGCDAQSEARVVTRAEALFAEWETVARNQSSSGSPFFYDEGSPQRRLLQYPLDPLTQNLIPEQRDFVAPRSMRDVEFGVMLKLRDPQGNEISGATDL